MKRFLMLLMLVLLPAIALGENDALFPARGDNGKMGYINRQGEFVIAPQFDGAGEFRGDYAEIVVYPHEEARENPWDYDVEGIIDREGNILLPPEYSIDGGYGEGYYGGKDTGIWYITQYEKYVWDPEDESLISASKTGFFDIPSGHFSGLQWEMVGHWCSDSSLIAVVNDGKAGYADRATGELVIPYRYFANDPSNFYEGVASVAFVDEDWNATDFFLINEQGEEIPLPEGITSTYSHVASEGRIAIEEKATGLMGFADLQGNVVIPPQFIRVNDFADGYALVQFPEGDWAAVDPWGAVLQRGLDDAGWWGYSEGLLAIERDGKWGYVNSEGEVVIPLIYDYASSFEDGLAYVHQNYVYSLIDITGQVISQWTDEE